MTESAKNQKTKTFVVLQDPDPFSLPDWEAGDNYKEGDLINYDDMAMECRTENKDKEFDQKSGELLK